VKMVLSPLIVKKEKKNQNTPKSMLHDELTCVQIELL
jgi:hypothetical protein